VNWWLPFPHDLRTPLASVRASVEALLDGVVTDTTTVELYLRTARRVHCSALAPDSGMAGPARRVERLSSRFVLVSSWGLSMSALGV